MHSVESCELSRDEPTLTVFSDRSRSSDERFTYEARQLTQLKNEGFMTAQWLPLAAIGYSIIYMLLGGGLFGAIVIFIIAKALKK